jgi:hypothetical protein
VSCRDGEEALPVMPQLVEEAHNCRIGLRKRVCHGTTPP